MIKRTKFVVCWFNSLNQHSHSLVPVMRIFMEYHLHFHRSIVCHIVYKNVFIPTSRLVWYHMPDLFPNMLMLVIGTCCFYGDKSSVREHICTIITVTFRPTHGIILANYLFHIIRCGYYRYVLTATLKRKAGAMKLFCSVVYHLKFETWKHFYIYNYSLTTPEEYVECIFQ